MIGQISAPNQLRTRFELASVVEFGSICTYVDDFAVCVADETVEEDPDALVAPDSERLVHVVEPVGRGHRQTVVDT